MLSAYSQFVCLGFVTLLLLPMAIPNPIPRHFHDMLTSEEETPVDSSSNQREIGLNDYQADIFDNRITVDEKIAKKKLSQQSSSSMNLPPGKNINKLLRPSPSDELPTKELIMTPTSKDKLPKDLDFRFVRKILGDDYDSNFMSESRPLESILKPNGSIDIDYKNALPKEELPPEIRHLSFNVPGKNNPSKIKSKKQRRKLRQKLWAHVSCPVVYKWKDLGTLFWPRWVKEGDCYRAHSCSIPAGMQCQPNQKIEKTFLFWHCRSNARCQWIKIHYPIITKCKCGC